MLVAANLALLLSKTQGAGLAVITAVSARTEAEGCHAKNKYEQVFHRL